jgi:hypothetical protein
MDQIDHPEATGGEKPGFIEALDVRIFRGSNLSSCVHHDQQISRCVARNPQPMLQFVEPPIDAPHRRDVPLAACSSAAKRASISSISIALAAWLKIESAARTRTDAGALASIMIFSSVVAAAEVPCWSRAMDCPNASRRACR